MFYNPGFYFFNPYIRYNEKTQLIDILNIDVGKLIRDIEKIYNTKTVAKYMFSNIKRGSFSIEPFWIPDLYFSLSAITFYSKRYSKTSAIKDLMIELKNKTWFKSYFQKHLDILDFSQLSQMTYKPLEPQMLAMKAYNEKKPKMLLKGYLLSAAVGSGKSFISLSITAMLKSKTTIIVCPKNLIDKVWIDEINTHYRDKKNISTSLDNEFIKEQDFYIVNYESIAKLSEFLIHNPLTEPPTIILDECHNLNDVDSIRSKQYIEFCKQTQSDNILHLSGTAIKMMGAEAATLFRVIDPLFNRNVEEQFKKIYGKSASRATEILRNRIDLVSHKILQSDIMTGKKPINIDIKVKVKNSERFTIPYIQKELVEFVKERQSFYKHHIKEYEKHYYRCLHVYERTIKNRNEQRDFEKYLHYVKIMKKGFDVKTMSEYSQYCNRFEKNKIIPALSSNDKRLFKDAKSVVKYVSLKILGEFLGGVLSKRRAEMTQELIEQSKIDKIVAQAEKKTVCFTDYVPAVKSTNEYFIKRGFKPLLVYGETNKDISSIIDNFKEVSDYNPLIATFKSLATGVTLINANVCIILNPPFRSLDITQATARVYRYGQTAQVYFYHLHLDTGNIPNLSSRMQEIMDISKQAVESIMGKATSIDDLNIDPDIFIASALDRTHESLFAKIKRNLRLKF